MAVIQLQPEQVSLFWDALKHAVVQVYRVPVGRREEALNSALAELMSGKYQCWVMYDFDEEKQERRTYAVVVTSIVRHKLLGTDFLMVDAVYGFRKLNDEIIRDSFQSFVKFAENNGCNRVCCESSVSRVIQVVGELGFKEVSKCFEYVL